MGTGFGPFLFCVAVSALLISGVLTGLFNAKWGFVPEEPGKVSVFLGTMTLIGIPIFVLLVRVFSAFRERIPELGLLDEVGYKSIAVGWPLFTVGAMLAGAIWAHQLWGRYWGWDPIETWSLVCWLAYGLVLHLRLMMNWRGNRMAVMVILALATAVMYFWGIGFMPASHTTLMMME